MLDNYCIINGFQRLKRKNALRLLSFLYVQLSVRRRDGLLRLHLIRRLCGFHVFQLSLLFLFGLCVCAYPLNVLSASKIRIAVASNFVVTIKTLAPLFEQQSGHSLSISSASTGKHFAQINNGAPFDVFLAADANRPALLEKNGYSLEGSRFTYAVGKLVVWGSKPSQSYSELLESGHFKRLAIANPMHAPYGLAAQETLQAMDLWGGVQSKLLRAENVTQAFQFVVSNNAELGFASLAQLTHLQEKGLFTGAYWLVPQSLYTPIEQQAVILRDSQAARDFVAFMQSEPVKQIMRDHGYDTL